MSTTADDVFFLRLPEVKRVTGLGRDSIYRLIRTQQFPAGRKLSERATGWRSDEVHAWVESRRPTVEAVSA